MSHDARRTAEQRRYGCNDLRSVRDGLGAELGIVTHRLLIPQPRGAQQSTRDSNDARPAKATFSFASLSIITARLAD
jgi:hypothetical protein